MFTLSISLHADSCSGHLDQAFAERQAGWYGGWRQTRCSPLSSADSGSQRNVLCNYLWLIRVVDVPGEGRAGKDRFGSGRLEASDMSPER